MWPSWKLLLFDFELISFRISLTAIVGSLRLLLAQLFLTGSGCFDWQQKEPHQDDVMYEVELGMAGQLMFRFDCEHGRRQRIKQECCSCDCHYIIKQLQVGAASEMRTKYSSSLMSRISRYAHQD